jgi:ankyrin repeat protein
MKIDKNETLYEFLSGMDFDEVEKENGLEKIQTFLKEGKNVSLNKIENPPYSDLQAPLDIAAAYIGSTKLVKILIEAGAKFAQDIQGTEKENKWNEPINQQLYDPIKNNDIAEVERLIQKGLDKDDQKCTPLLMAAKTGNVKIMSLLVKTNLFTDVQHQTVVRTALEKNNIKILDYFTSFDSELGFDEIYWIAIDSQNIKMLEYCLNIQYSPYKNSMLKNFPFILCDAIEKEYIEVVRFLLKNGADPNKKDDDNRNPLAEANKTCNKEIIKLLVDAGAKL